MADDALRDLPHPVDSEEVAASAVPFGSTWVSSWTGWAAAHNAVCCWPHHLSRS